MGSAVAREEKQVFAAYLTQHRLKRSEQREVIVDTFLRSDRHLSVDDLLRLVQKRRPDIGRTTVYRTLKLLQAAGLARSWTLQGQTRFEREYKREHHDHFICNVAATRSSSSRAPTSSASRTRSRRDIGFVIEGHRHHIFGLCRRCASRGPPREEARRRPGF